jgi:hypothetical protein
MAKCSVCKQTVGKTFLEKPIGTYVKKKGKKHLICNKCQKSLSTEEILEKV